MKTTIEVPEDLYQQAKHQAEMRGCKLTELIEEGLRLVIQEPPKKETARLSELMKNACGLVDSGMSDLASNPKHLSGFGQNASSHS